VRFVSPRDVFHCAKALIGRSRSARFACHKATSRETSRSSAAAAARPGFDAMIRAQDGNKARRTRLIPRNAPCFVILGILASAWQQGSMALRRDGALSLLSALRLESPVQLLETAERVGEGLPEAKRRWARSRLKRRRYSERCFQRSGR
jgi:hypothetical protein